MHSWGYLKDRCRHLGLNMIKELSRIITENEQTSEYLEEITNSEIKIKGRIVLDIWKLLRHEVINIKSLKAFIFNLSNFLILVSSSKLYI